MSRYRVLIFVAATLSAALWAYACGDGVTEPPTPPPDPPRPATVTVTPDSVVFTAIGQTEQLSAEVRDQNGQVMAGAAVTWTSSATSIATVSGSGLVTAAGNGTATITASAGSASGTATVTVAQEVSAVAVTPAADTLVAGDTLRLSAEATDANGHPVAEAEFSWASGDTSVAAVDDAGLVTGVGAGQVEVTATAAGVTGRAELTVVDPAPTTVSVTPDTVALMAIGQPAQLTAEVRDQAGRVMEGEPVSWSSADTTVAAVDPAGLVTAAGVGETTITATSGEASGEAVVTVMQSADSVIVSPSADTVALGDTLRLVAEAFDENGHVVGGAVFTWASRDVSVATVDGSGLVTGVAEGTATITAEAGSAGGTAEIAVENPDRAALVALYNATDGPNWVNSDNWLTDAPLGDWYGVDTDGYGRVTRLSLYDNGLSGPVSPTLGQLANLTDLELGSDSLTGPIPPELGNLANLTRLTLSNNSLTGPIPPELGNLANLTRLGLSSNRLTGAIPPELGNLADLGFLHLSGNDLTGAIPPELGDLANLTWLNLASNNLSGPIPPELGNLVNLGVLNLASTNVSGPIPSELGNLVNLIQLYLPGNSLTGTIPPELGNLANVSSFWLSDNSLTGPIPPELGNLANLEQLNLAGNGLTGTIPPELGNLAKLDWLGLSSNRLSGPIPRSLLELEGLTQLNFHENPGLCTPGTTAFVAWRERINRDEGPYCNELDARVLDGFYQTSGGADWTNATGWLATPALEEWYGVTADSLGRVMTLDLAGNGLAGRIPSTLGRLAEMTRLRIGGNALSGQLPPSLTRLPLVEFHYASTELCTPTDSDFRAWLNRIASHEGTGVNCAQLSDRDILVALYNSTGGANWKNAENWLTDAPLGDWHGVGTDGDDRVTSLHFSYNDLTGPLPPELGNLANLEQLEIGWNDLTGPLPPELGNLANLTTLILSGNSLLDGRIPPELGDLANLEILYLWGNRLSGPIPPELGDLANLGSLILGGNRLEGPLPSELGNLPNLKRMRLNENRLSGPLPPELGSLANLVSLNLGGNKLSGQIPPELGNLANLKFLTLYHNNLSGLLPGDLGRLATLEELHLDFNGLAGPVPPEFSGLANLTHLGLTRNWGLWGALPASVTQLRRLEVLLAGGTDLCAPRDTGFQDWLQTVDRQWIARCEDATSIAYLTQASPSRKFPVPMVAGEDALLRVFVTAAKATSEGIPEVIARFYRGGNETHTMRIPGKPTPIPTDVDEGSLSKSTNAEIPGEIVRPGLEMVIEIDPEGTLDPGLGVARRIPETGRLAVDVREMPPFDLTVIPFLCGQNPDSALVEITAGMAADPENHPLLWDTRTLLPVGGLKVTAHEPVLSNCGSKLSQTEAIRRLEGGTGYYMGIRNWGAPLGEAYVRGRSSVSIPGASTIVHELGHNMSLLHANCGPVDRPDPVFPTRSGSIGAWGYDFRDGGSLVHPTVPDLMSYCEPAWISAYHFNNALRYRLSDEGASGAAIASSATRSLLLWGGVDADSEPFLEPAFVVEAPAALPDAAGEHRITGRRASGGELFSFTFTMPEVADGDGSSSFAFVLPAQPGWAGSLASITLSGPGGSVTLDDDSHLRMAILRNPRTGQVRGILRGGALTQTDAEAAMSSGLNLEVLFSRGIPDAEAWRR